MLAFVYQSESRWASVEKCAILNAATNIFSTNHDVIFPACKNKAKTKTKQIESSRKFAFGFYCFFE
jgi:hypothetical protein